jgi:hypothetical protein
MPDNLSAGGAATSAGLRPTKPDPYTIVATAQAVRWGYTTTLDADTLATWISQRAASFNLRADVDAVLTALTVTGQTDPEPAAGYPAPQIETDWAN